MAQAATDGPTTYPKMPAKAWAVLRAKANTAPSTKFTPAYVATALGMSTPTSAKSNVVNHLVKLGVITEDGVLTDLGHQWRVDASYSQACEQIIKNVYPDEIASFTTDSGDPDKAQIETWFQHHGFGGSNATQMAATYVLVAQKKIPDPASGDGKKNAPAKKAAPAKKVVKPAVDTPVNRPEPAMTPQAPQVSDAPVHHAPTGGGPNVHLDIQIHIPAEATAGQIDQIFASMAKHLYQR